MFHRGLLEMLEKIGETEGGKRRGLCRTAGGVEIFRRSLENPLMCNRSSKGWIEAS
jgi:hypothetical protein